MATPIGALLVELGANTAAFRADMGRAVAILNTSSAQMNRSLAGIQRSFGNVTRAAGLFGIGLGTGAVVAFGKATLDTVMIEQLNGSLEPRAISAVALARGRGIIR